VEKTEGEVFWVMTPCGDVVLHPEDGGSSVLTGFLLGGPKARDHWEDLGIGRRITLKWTVGI
jgi:hypothetical protein